MVSWVGDGWMLPEMECFYWYERGQKKGVEPKIGGFHPPKWMVKINGKVIKIDDLGVPLFLETSKSINQSSFCVPLQNVRDRGRNNTIRLMEDFFLHPLVVNRVHTWMIGGRKLVFVSSPPSSWRARVQFVVEILKIIFFWCACIDMFVPYVPASSLISMFWFIHMW